MGDLFFQWDKGKERANWRKHRVSFEEAASVFRDRYAIMLMDEVHSQTEDRWIMLGLSVKTRVLCVVHVERGAAIRIISARRATLHEAETYAKNRW